MQPRVIVLDLPDEAATARLAEDVAAAARPGLVVALSGDLGAGKTTLARALIRALADDADLEVPSPTFTLVQAYEARVPVRHFDLYRLSAPDELEEIGFFDAIADTVTLVEWPHRAGSALPADALRIELGDADTGRTATVSGPSERLALVERSLAIRAFLTRAGLATATRRHLVGDASARAYETIRTDAAKPLVLMNAPQQPDGPPLRDGKPYSRIAHLAESVVPFVAVARALRGEGFAAPDIVAADLDAGILLIEHLGSDGILDTDGVPIADRYIASAELLAALHGREWNPRMEADAEHVHVVPDYDHGAMAIETELVTDWYMPERSGRPTSDDERAAFAVAWGEAFDRVATAETSLILRDYHSPNIIWRGDREGIQRIGLLDFQDALIGPSVFDVASLALDARVTIEPALERAIVDAYCAAREAEGPFDREVFDAAYAIMATQRNSKILGIFVRLARRDGKLGYLRHLPRIRAYLRRTIAHPALAEVARFYAEHRILEEEA